MIRVLMKVSLNTQRNDGEQPSPELRKNAPRVEDGVDEKSLSAQVRAEREPLQIALTLR